MISIGHALKCLQTPLISSGKLFDFAVKDKRRYEYYEEYEEEYDEYEEEYKEYLEYGEIECSHDEDRCINVETTLDYKIKGCSKVENLENFVNSHLQGYWLMGLHLELDGIELKKDECKKIPSEVMNPIKARVDEMNLGKLDVDEDQRREIDNWEAFEAYTVCTCSSDLCNGGIRLEAKKIMLFIFSFIMSIY